MRGVGMLLVVAAGCGGAQAEPAPPVQAEAADASTPPALATVDAAPPEAPKPFTLTTPPDPAPTVLPPAPPPPPPQPLGTAKERKACAARGGELRPTCMDGAVHCILRYRDAGKKCSDKSECTGRCLYRGDSAAARGGAKVTGECQVDSDNCGCGTDVVHGVAHIRDCVD